MTAPPIIRRIGDVLVIDYGDGIWTILGIVTDDDREPGDDGTYPSFDPEVGPPPKRDE